MAKTSRHMPYCIILRSHQYDIRQSIAYSNWHEMHERVCQSLASLAAWHSGQTEGYGLSAPLMPQGWKLVPATFVSVVLVEILALLLDYEPLS